MAVFSTFKLEKLELGGSNQKVANINDDQDPKPICRHPLENTVTITLNIHEKKHGLSLCQ